jgi:hypothetical protein
MNSSPPESRGAASGMRATFQNSGMVLSVGVFFSLLIVGLANSLPSSMSAALRSHGVAAATAHRVAATPPVGSLFAAFLGYNPMKQLLGSAHAAGVSSSQWASITGKTFFPHLIADPFIDGLRIAFTASLIMCLVAGAASWLRGGRYVHGMGEEASGSLGLPGVDDPELDDVSIGQPVGR